jgi:hypothetical protein
MVGWYAFILLAVGDGGSKKVNLISNRFHPLILRQQLRHDHNNSGQGNHKITRAMDIETENQQAQREELVKRIDQMQQVAKCLENSADMCSMLS